jgi:hypothetical protein
MRTDVSDMTNLAELGFTAFYEAAGDIFSPSPATSSPWDEGAQHGGPPSALLAWAFRANHPRENAIVARASIDFLGTIPRIPLRVRTRIIRPGARVELGEAVLAGCDDEREYLVGRFWRIRTADIPLPGDRAVDIIPAIPPSQPQRYFPGLRETWGYGHAIEWRFVSGSLQAFGPADAWTRVRVPLIEGVELDPLSRALIVADSINGLSVELPISEYFSIPPGLTVTLDRYPSSDWVYLNARTRLTARGVGHAEGWLGDADGRLGLVAQPLLIETR